MDIELDKASERNFKTLHQSLGEKDGRRLAGSLYKLSGNMSYICKLLSVSDKTVRKGLNEINQPGLRSKRFPGIVGSRQFPI